jgi:hypothetical protein
VEPRRFYIDVQNRQFLASPDSTLPASGNLFFQEDVEAIRLYFLRPTGIFNQPYEYLDYSDKTVKFAIGSVSPAVLQTSWTSVSSTVAPTITEIEQGDSTTNEVQRLTFSQTPTSGSVVLSLPERQFSVTAINTATLQTAEDHNLLFNQKITLGSGLSSTENIEGTFYVRPGLTSGPRNFSISRTESGPILGDDFDINATATATLSSVKTQAIPWNASAVAVEDALSKAIVATWFSETSIYNNIRPIVVTGSFSSGFSFLYEGSIFAKRNLANIQILSSDLLAPAALAANVSFNTAEVAALILGGNISDLPLEVEVSSGAVRQTYRTTASLSPHIITSTSPSPLPLNVATSFDLSDGAGGIWTITIDPSGTLTTAKQ